MARCHQCINESLVFGGEGSAQGFKIILPLLQRSRSGYQRSDD